VIYAHLDNWLAGSGVHDCAAQLPHRHRRHDQDLAGRRLRQYWCPGSLDGNLLPRRWNSNANRNRDSHSYGNGYCYCDSYSNGHAETYTLAKAAPDSGTAPVVRDNWNYCSGAL